MPDLRKMGGDEGALSNGCGSWDGGHDVLKLCCLWYVFDCEWYGLEYRFESVFLMVRI